MSKLFAEKNITKIAQRQISVLPKSLVLVNSQEFGINSQISEVRKINKNLNFSINKIVFLKTLQVSIVEEIRIINIIGKLKKFNLILGRKIKKN
jgi:hypothetical protein